MKAKASKFFERGLAAQTAVDQIIATEADKAQQRGAEDYKRAASAKMPRVLLPDEVEERNIITAKELRVAVEALDALLNAGVDPPYISRSKIALARSAKRKIERTLAGMMGGGRG